MSSPVTPRLVEAFDRRVLAFQTPNFSLYEDLDWMGRLRAIDAPVGVILHASRILEVLANDALDRVGLVVVKRTLEKVLEGLADGGHLPGRAYRLLDRLRDLGNAARHARARVGVGHAEQGFALVVRGMQWYFCEFAGGLRLNSLTAHNEPLDALLPDGLRQPLALLESAKIGEHGFLRSVGLDRPDAALLLSPVFPAILAERLLDDRRHDPADAVLSAARQHFPDDVRIRQLQGLLWSRTGRLSEACDCLGAIGRVDPVTDQETHGILAGAYKRRAEAEPERRVDWLKAAHKRYERGWRDSQRTNTYLGINTAALALRLGMAGQVEPIARRVRVLLEARREQLARSGTPERRFLNVWDQLSLAEAHLLLRSWEEAKRLYAEARERFAAQKGALGVADEQGIVDLTALGRADLAGDIFPLVVR
jgi:tetratricopeptide (TPR) repeat protein